MTSAQRKLRELREKQSKHRQRMAELAQEDSLSDEMRAELDSIERETPDLERQIRAATAALDEEERAALVSSDDDPEKREIRELRSKVSVQDWSTAALELRHVDGAAKEYAEAHDLRAGQFPLHILAPPEVRATTDADGAVDQKTWLDRLFAESMAAYLGVTMQTVSPGAAAYPVTTAGATAAQKGRGEAAADAAWTVAVTKLEPTRNAVRAVYSNEDALRLPGLESSLMRDLGKVLVEGVDRVVFLGDSGANENSADVAGLTTATGVSETTLKQADKVKPGKTLEAFTGLVDGKHASSMKDLKIVAAVGANVLWDGTILAVGSETASIFKTMSMFLREQGLSWEVRGDLEDATSNGKFGAFIGRQRGISGAAVCPVWDKAELIRDPYSGAAKGEVALTLATYWNFGLPRASNFARIKFVT